MSQLLAIVSPLEIAAEQAGEGSKLPRFSMLAYTGGKMRLGGWKHPVVVDLAGMKIPSQRIPIQADHDMSAGVGHTESVTIENGQLKAAGVISRGTPVAAEIVASSRNGFPWQASIGASADEVEYVKPSETAAVNGQTVEGPANIVRASTLGEISFVPLGTDSNTTASIAAKLNKQEGRGMTDLKERRAALIKAHGEQHAGIILAALIDGKEDADISQEIQAAQLDALTVRAAKAEAELAEAQAKLAEQAEEIKSQAAEIDRLKAGQPRKLPADVGTEPGGGGIETITRAQACKMTRDQLAAFRAGKLKIE